MSSYFFDILSTLTKTIPSCEAYYNEHYDSENMSDLGEDSCRDILTQMVEVVPEASEHVNSHFADFNQKVAEAEAAEDLAQSDDSVAVPAGPTPEATPVLPLEAEAGAEQPAADDDFDEEEEAAPVAAKPATSKPRAAPRSKAAPC
eukprot:gnl/Ergobibamus_cyprinoides/1840.p1 GENE.gnl/Ergobibamus_cyprinoides/1840~~gnl/Ergobibamus_cyprinoides/1840.p1  ORF type:complete len:146 (+),score=59.75 gnl/Ergobibamus_cyprinoides/1840:221-658(+)